VGIAALAFYAYRSGVTVCEQEYEAARAVELAAHLDELNKEIERGHAIAKELAEFKAKSSRTRVVNATNAASIAACGSPPADLVRVHDHAAQGEAMPPTPSGVACAPSTTVNHGHLAATIVENYGACNEYIQQLNALIEWHEKGTP
jgi:hypothetical protein